MNRYQIAEGPSYEVESQANALINQGWKPIGSLQMSVAIDGYGYPQYYYSQAFILEMNDD